MKKHIVLTIALLSLAGVSSINAGKTGAFFGGLGTGVVLTKVAQSGNNNNRGGNCHCPDVSGYKETIADQKKQIKELRRENKGHQRTIGKHEGTIARLEKKLDQLL